MAKLFRMSRVAGDAHRAADTVRQGRLAGDDRRRATDVLLEAQTYYCNMHRFREMRERCKRYDFGDQWGDTVCVNGCRMTEEQYIMKQGSIPLKNNLIRRLVRNVVGVYRSQDTEPTCTARDRDEQAQAETMSTVLQYNMQLNRMRELYARSMEEFLISGLVVHRKWYGWRQDKMECWTDYVQPNNFFVDNNMRDFRTWDCSCIGEIHDISFEQLAEQFARTPADYGRLADIYRAAHDRVTLATAFEDFGFKKQDLDTGFLTPRDESRCRVIEVWRKESKPRYRCHDYNTGDIFKIDTEDFEELVGRPNAERLRQAQEAGMATEDVPLVEAEWFVDSYWYYYYLTPFGDILAEGETPYEHRSHPYVFRAYPFLDGEVHSFVADVIDQQRYTNRLITLYDWIMRSSAKGALLVPSASIPADMTPEEFARAWVRFNGVIVYDAKPGVPAPQQVAANSTNIGIQELLQLQLKLFEDISGVNGALQGKPGYSGMSASLYNQQAQNATTSLIDLLETFGEFVKDAAYKDVKNIQQFYDKERVFNIAGKSGKHVTYAPDKIHDIEFDLSIIPSTATPAYRAMANDFLMEIWKSQQISLEQLLEVGDFPFADRLLQSIAAQREKLQQGQRPGALPQDVQAQARQGADMAAVRQLDAAMGPAPDGQTEVPAPQE